MTEPRPPEGAFATLRRFIRPRALVERCDLCSIELAAKHQHLMAPSSQQLLCACDACAILFSYRSEAPYRRVPQRIGRLSAFHLTDAQWESLMIPIGMAFFFHSTPAGKIVAIYPSPAGPTESLLDLASWEEIEQYNPMLRQMEPDVEALLVNRVEHARDYYLTPIDVCYKLVGLVRTYWQGLSGGREVWTEIGNFFDDLRQQSRSIGEEPRA
jgi:hypothetical protein